MIEIKQISVWTLLAFVAATGIATAQSIPAFPGAEGPGGNATGGRGGDVYHVTNLEFDLDGTIPGSLKYGIHTAPAAGRTIVFDVGGTIYHDGGGAGWWFRSSKSNITIAGQTAPGPGITIAGVGSKWTGNNVILRNINIRPNKDPANPTNFTYDAFGLQLTSSIVDHVTASWFTDEGIPQTDAGHSATVQYAMINEGLNYNGHAYGSIISTEVDGARNSFHHNLYAHLKSRIPRVGSEMSTTETGAIASIANNVIYNWQPNSAGYSGTDQPSSTNFLNNYYIKGANNGQTPFDGGDDNGAAGVTKVYENGGNKIDLNKNGAIDGNFFNQFTSNPKAFAGGMTFYPAAFNVSGVGTLDTADEALERVLAYGGSQWWNRHPIEQRIVQSVRNGSGAMITDLTTGTQAAEWATVLSQRPTNGVAPFSRDANWDTDRDGMPNDWEDQHRLNANLAENNGDFDNDGCTNLEEYINEIAAWPAPGPIVFQGVTSRFAEIQNWRVSGQSLNIAGQGNVVSSSLWQPSRFDVAVINNGDVTVDSVGQHAGTIQLGPGASDHATLSITGGWLKLDDAPSGPGNGEIMIGATPTATARLNLSGGKLIAKTLSKGAGGSFNFTGGVLSAETINFDLVNNGGTLSPGNSTGSTQVNGDLTLNSGALEIELASAIGFDRVSVSGNVALGGELHAKVLDGFVPDNDDVFTVLTGASVNGSFSNVSGDRVPIDGIDGSFRVTVDPTAVILSDFLFASSPLPGDYNGDSSVDAADYVAWRKGLGSRFNTDDYIVWRANFGATSGSGSTVKSNVVTPEPATLLALVLGMAMAIALRCVAGCEIRCAIPCSVR
jgi:hypothetical protein